MTPQVLSAGTMIGDDVRNPQGENLGKIEEVMLDVDDGRVSYAVLSFGGVMGVGNKLFAIPWQSLQLDADDHKFVLNVSKEQLNDAPGFDKDNWPNMANRQFQSEVYSYYGVDPYWS